jgi:hypothetical protein
MTDDNAALMRVIDAMPPQRRAEYYREIAAYYLARYEREGCKNYNDLAHANALNAEADHWHPRDPRQADEAAAFSLMPPTPPAPKDTTLNLF